MRVLQQANNVFVKSTRVSNSFSNLEEGITYIPFLDSGSTYLTHSNATNDAIINTASYPCLYSRVGDVVTMNIPIEVQMDAAETSTAFNLSLPIGSNFTGVKQAFGVCSSDNQPEIVSFSIQSDDGGLSEANTLFVSISTLSTGTVFPYLTLSVQYLVL